MRIEPWRLYRSSTATELPILEPLHVDIALFFKKKMEP